MRTPFPTSLFFGFFALILLVLPFAAKPALACGGILLTAVATAILYCVRDRVTISRGLCWALLAIAALALTSTLWSPDFNDAMIGALRLTLILACALILITCATFMPLPSQRWLLLLPLCAAVALTLLTSFHLTQFALQHWWLDGVRGASSTMVNKATGASALLLPPLCALLLARSPWGIWGALALGLLAALGIIIGESQSSLLAVLVFAVAMILPVKYRTFWKVLRITLIGGILLAPWLAQALFNTLAVPISEIALLQPASIPQRLEVWHAFAMEIFRHPLLGQGFDAARHIERLEINEIYQRGIAFTHPHNMALQIWLEFGALGAALAAILTGLLLRAIEAVPDKATRRLYLSAFLPIFVVAQIGWGMWQVWWLILIVLVATLTIIAGRLMQRDKTPA